MLPNKKHLIVLLYGRETNVQQKIINFVKKMWRHAFVRLEVLGVKGIFVMLLCCFLGS